MSRTPDDEAVAGETEDPPDPAGLVVMIDVRMHGQRFGADVALIVLPPYHRPVLIFSKPVGRQRTAATLGWIVNAPRLRPLRIVPLHLHCPFICFVRWY